MLRKTRIRHLFAVLAALLALSAAAAARAHPLGNFTISRYSAVTLAGERAEVLYIVDMAEIPTFRERQTMDVDGDGAPSAAEQEAYLAALIPDLAANLSLTIDGSTVPLTPARHVLTFPPGQGGLPTMRLELWLTAALPAASAPLAVAYEDRNFADRLGWREIVVSAESGTLLDSSVPATDASDQLRDYPADLLQAPLAVSAATARYAPVGVPATTDAAPVPVTAPVAANRFSQDEFANLLSRTLDTPAALAAALLVAVGLGAAHALTPGHGKTIVGAYLVGSRGTARHALFLGLTTTITHTAGVFALGLLVLFASEFILPEKLYPWLGVLSGLLVVFIGLSIFRGHFRHWLAHRRGGDHDHGAYHFHLGKGHTHEHRPPTADGRPRSADGRRTTDDSRRVLALEFAAVMPGGARAAVGAPGRVYGGHGHGHSHDHEHTRDHQHDHGHDHAAASGDALGWRNLLALGVSGGLLPCPSALILMLSAIALRQVGVGLVLILAFSVGLAGVLTGIGLFMVYAGRLLERLPIRHGALTTRVLPMASAAFITAAGLFITFRALAEAGVL